MKSNVVLQSKDRVLLGMNVSVMSKDGYICITDAMKALSAKREKLGLAPKQLSHIIETESFKERCTELVNKLENKLLLSRRNLLLNNNKLNISSVMDLGKLDLAYKKGKGVDQKWYVNPYLFVMIALEMDPEIYAEVVIWLTDGLIENRNEAGDAYVRMCSAISRIVSNKNDLKDNIKRVAKAINFIVFNKHEDGIRNTASKDELNDIIAIENVIASVIDDGFVKDYNSLINYLGDKWKRKWGNPVLALK